jgi:hypothetical protein
MRLLDSLIKHPYAVKSNRPYAEILLWLQENVGKVIWSQPIVGWHGEGWHMRSTPEIGATTVSCYTIEFQDKEHAVIFRLWS